MSLAASMRQTASTARCVADFPKWAGPWAAEWIKSAAPGQVVVPLLLSLLLLDQLVVAIELLLVEAKVLGRHDLADLDLDVAVAVGLRPLLDQFDHFRERARLDDRIAGDQFLGLPRTARRARLACRSRATQTPLALGISPAPSFMTPLRTIISL